MKMRSIFLLAMIGHPIGNDRFTPNFAWAEELMSFASRYNQQVRGHTSKLIVSSTSFAVQLPLILEDDAMNGMLSME